nr:formate dehydrogenase accessory sulfurtransferase FdhD [Arthrobacter roseus]
MTQRVKVTTYSANAPARSVQDVLAAEEPLEIRVNGRSLSITMRTPGDDFDLVAGFLVSEGIIGHQEQLATMRFCAGEDESGLQTYNVIDAELAPGVEPPSRNLHRQVITSSACGICGTASIDAVTRSSRYTLSLDEVRLDVGTLLGLPDILLANQKLFDRTGGVHAAGLFSSGGDLLCLREDVGRHNAVDKVIGWALREDLLPLSGTVLQVSGRASFELVQKAFLAGIPVLSAVSAPSSLAVALAEASGLTLAGFSRGARVNVYTHQERITSGGH